MSGRLDLSIDGAVVRRVPAPGRAVRVGRAPDNDVVVADPEVSAYHLVLDWDGDRLRAHDPGSTNGTFVDGGRVDDLAEVGDGSVIRLGTRVRLGIGLSLAAAEAGPTRWLWHRDTGRCHALADGAGPLEALLGGPLAEGPWQLEVSGAEVVVRGPNEVLSLAANEPAVIGGAHVQVVDREVALGDTAAAGEDPFWRLVIEVDGRAGPTASVFAPGRRLRGEIRAANRVVVLHLLAEQSLRDAEDGVARADHGWVDDEHVMRGVWGRAWTSKGPAAFQVLVHRLRKDLARLGLAGGVVEKRSGNTRLRPGLVEVELASAAG